MAQVDLAFWMPFSEALKVDCWRGSENDPTAQMFSATSTSYKVSFPQILPHFIIASFTPSHCTVAILHKVKWKPWCRLLPGAELRKVLLELRKPRVQSLISQDPHSTAGAGEGAAH